MWAREGLRHIEAGDRFRNARDWASAAESYRRAVTHDPSLWAIWIQLGHALKESGDYPGAEEAYLQALVRNSRCADTYLQLGHLHKISGRYREAEAAYVISLTFDPALDDAKREIEILGGSSIIEFADRKRFASCAFRALLQRDFSEQNDGALLEGLERGALGRGSFLDALLQSPMFAMRGRTVRTTNQQSDAVDDDMRFIQDVYRGVLGRDPEPAAFELYGPAFTRGFTREGMLREFADSERNRVSRKKVQELSAQLGDTVRELEQSLMELLSPKIQEQLSSVVSEWSLQDIELNFIAYLTRLRNGLILLRHARIDRTQSAKSPS